MYRTVQTGPNSQLGGVSAGRCKFSYQSFMFSPFHSLRIPSALCCVLQHDSNRCQLALFPFNISTTHPQRKHNADVDKHCYCVKQARSVTICKTSGLLHALTAFGANVRKVALSNSQNARNDMWPILWPFPCNIRTSVMLLSASAPDRRKYRQTGSRQARVPQKEN